MAFIKIGARELPPLFMAGLRSLVAGACVYIWIKSKGTKLFPSKAVLFHGIVIGLLFAGEFAFFYLGLMKTTASRACVLIYCAPFFAAVEAHFFIAGDLLNPWKAAGLLFAFFGVVVLFARDLGSFSFEAMSGDLMALTAGFLWGTTSVYVKKYMARGIPAIQALFYQLFFSTPPLLLLSFALEDPTFRTISLATGFSLFYQCIIVAFLSYIIWFTLILRHPVSLLHAFSFFTPVFGVFISGSLMLGEVITAKLIAALILVSAGMVLVNYQPTSGIK